MEALYKCTIHVGIVYKNIDLVKHYASRSLKIRERQAEVTSADILKGKFLFFIRIYVLFKGIEVCHALKGFSRHAIILVCYEIIYPLPRNKIRDTPLICPHG